MNWLCVYSYESPFYKSDRSLWIILIRYTKEIVKLEKNLIFPWSLLFKE